MSRARYGIMLCMGQQQRIGCQWANLFKYANLQGQVAQFHRITNQSTLAVHLHQISNISLHLCRHVEWT